MRTNREKIEHAGLKASQGALDRIDKGFEGNGCGSGIPSHLVCGSIQKVIGTDFSLVWMIHDSEYTESRTLKSDSKKITADSNLYYNINTVMGLNDRKPQRLKRTFARWLYVALIVGGYNAYWDIPSKYPSLSTLAIVFTVMYLLIGN